MGQAEDEVENQAQDEEHHGGVEGDVLSMDKAHEEREKVPDALDELDWAFGPSFGDTLRDGLPLGRESAWGKSSDRK